MTNPPSALENQNNIENGRLSLNKGSDARRSQIFDGFSLHLTVCNFIWIFGVKMSVLENN